MDTSSWLPDLSQVPTYEADWLLDPAPYRAGVYAGEHQSELVLANGLLRRVFRLAPNAATVGFDNLVTGASAEKGVK